jgi:hypothetical protein
MVAKSVPYSFRLILPGFIELFTPADKPFCKEYFPPGGNTILAGGKKICRRQVLFTSLQESLLLSFL